MSKEIEHVQFVSTCRKDEKIVQHVAKNGNMSNGNIRHVEATYDMLLQHVVFDMLLRHVAGVDGALQFASNCQTVAATIVVCIAAWVFNKMSMMTTVRVG